MGPCDWPVSYAECATCGPLEEATPEERERFETMAVDYLWRWTGQSLGVCEVTIYPCREECEEGHSTWHGSGPFAGGGTPWRPVIIDGRWFNVGCGFCRDDCLCGRYSSLRLPGPVVAVSEVLIDGEVLPPAAYVLDRSGSSLVRLDGKDWPACNAPAGQPGSWSVTYTRGTEVPTGGQVAAGILACEFAKAACNDASCALPKRFQSITRQGVTVAALDTFDDIEKGHTGIWLVDSWVASVTQTPQRSRVYSPDVKRRRGGRRW